MLNNQFNKTKVKNRSLTNEKKVQIFKRIKKEVKI